MKAMQRSTLMLAVAGALSLPTALLAADSARDEHGSHHPEAAPVTANAPDTTSPAAADRMQSMRARMMEMRATQDPDKRMRLMEAQMKDVESMMQGMGPGQGQGGGMMGSGMMRGMMTPGQKSKDCPMGDKGGMGMMGQGMPGGMMGMQGQNDMTAKRMDMMEKRMDMMQMMMQMRMQGMGGGMGPGMGPGMGGMPMPAR